MAERYYKPLVVDAVRPMKTVRQKHKPLVAVNAHSVMLESGEVLTHDEYVDKLPELPASYVVTYGADVLLQKLHARYGEHELWRWCVSERLIPLPNGKGAGVRTNVLYYGFKREAGGGYGQAPSRLHHIINYDTFVRSHELIAEHAPDLAAMLEIGKQLRAWCAENGIRVKASAAGTVAQFLRHSRFYPEPRRQVPAFINREARKRLPGNHYKLYANAMQAIKAATYIDQKAAHHYAAATTPLPHADRLIMQGCDKAEVCWLKYSDDPNSDYQQFLAREHGLLRMRAHVPFLDEFAGRWQPPCMETPGSQLIHVWTNELPYLMKWGLEPQWISCAWTSDKLDEGLPAYARWAQTEQARYPWLKTALLTLYGSLARNQRRLSLHYNEGKGVESRVIVAGRPLPSCETAIETSPNLTVNVVQRGLIEAHVRCLSLDLAHQLARRGEEVVSIYADGVFLKTPRNKQLPIFLTGPWREKGEINALEYESATRIRGEGFARLPGTPKLAREAMRTRAVSTTNEGT